jgi:hypothetical protein
MTNAAARSDFSDWLSPMLVKELRQGMRSRIFIAAFYLTQLLMILCVVFNLILSASKGQQVPLFGFLNGLFWFMISVPLLFVMPIRGFSALHGEMKTGTLELVFLTRLSAWRIAAGKWTAIVVQTLLLVCAILPYVLLRYFLGGVDIIEDLQSLFFLVVASAVLTAMTVAISPYESKLLRALFVIGLIFTFQFLIGIIFAWLASSSFGGASSRSTASWQLYVGLALFIPAFIILAIEIGASRIAPPAENHALRKRLIGLYLLLVAPLFVLAGADDKAVFPLALFFLAVVLIDAMAEPVVVIRSLYLPFLRRGNAGRILSLFFTPGWVSASWYVALIVALGGGILFWRGQFNDAKVILGYIACFGALIFPAALIRLFVPATRFFLGLYIGVQFFLGALSILVGMMAGISGEPLSKWLCLIPNCTFISSLFGQVQPGDILLFVTATLFTTTASLAVLLARTISPLRQIRAATSDNREAMS